MDAQASKHDAEEKVGKDKSLHVRVAVQERQALRGLTDDIYHASGVNPTLSQLARAALRVVMECKEHLIEEFRECQLPPAPSRKESLLYAQYEEQIIVVLKRALRRR